MTTVQRSPAGAGGFVRAIFSPRSRGFAAPLGLVCGHLRAVGAAALRRRLREEFAGYLVTDGAPDEGPAFLPCVTGGSADVGESGRPIDAPEAMPAGAVRERSGGFASVVQWPVLAGGLGRPVQVWRDERGRVIEIVHCRGFVSGALAADERAEAMDAPEFLPAGAMRAAKLAGVVYAVQVSVIRDGWFE